MKRSRTPVIISYTFPRVVKKVHSDNKARGAVDPDETLVCLAVAVARPAAVLANPQLPVALAVPEPTLLLLAAAVDGEVPGAGLLQVGVVSGADAVPPGDARIHDEHLVRLAVDHTALAEGRGVHGVAEEAVATVVSNPQLVGALALAKGIVAYDTKTQLPLIIHATKQD